jgi:hypothetical protein
MLTTDWAFCGVCVVGKGPSTSAATEATSVFDRFTELAKRTLCAFREAAAPLGNDYIGTEHQLVDLC